MKNTMNLYKKYKKGTVKEKQLSKTAAYLGISIALVLIVIAVGVRFSLEKRMLQNDIDDIQRYVSDEARVKKFEAANLISDESNQLTSFKIILDELDDVFKTKDTISSDILIEIYNAKPTDLTIRTMNINGGVIHISYESKRENASSTFVRGLKERNMVKEVTYSGYEYNESSESYTGTLSLVLRGNF